jgi:hypothetical protein
MTYRDDLDAMTARHDALATEVAYKTRELEAATRMLDEAKARLRLPILDNIRVASPCPQKWEDMTGDERSRHCAQCDKSVFNISGMTRDEAEALIIAKQGKLCVRYFQRKDGTILTKDCVVGISKKRKRRLFAASAAALLAIGGTGIALRMAGDDTEETEEELGQMREFGGEVAGGLQPIQEFKGEVSRPEVIEMRGQMVEPAHLTRPGDRDLP